MSPSPESSKRPRTVDIAFWCFVGSAVIMIVGGLMAATASYEAARAALPDTISDEAVRDYLTIYRYSGAGAAVAAAALAFLAGRARRGDVRSRMATFGLVFAILVVVLLLAVGAGVAQPLVLLALLPMLVGVAVFVQPGAREWYAREGTP
ncbi:MAG: hypothetical protein SW019_17005 [Actinomycetota bacterium]|nr:hypothetical protein [Actinomycetota bacterium]